MTKVDQKVRVNFQYHDALEDKKVGHTFSNIDPNVTEGDLRAIKNAIDSVAAQASDSVTVTESYQVIL